MKDITIKQLETYLSQSDTVLIDVRNAEDYAFGHIEGAVNYNLADLEEFAGDKDKTYLIICQLGQRSQVAASLLSDQGYKVLNVTEGMSAWVGSVVRDKCYPRS